MQRQDRHRIRTLVCAGLALVIAPCASVAADPAPPAVASAWQVRADAENWRLPGAESMGMVRLAMRRSFGPWIAAGIDGSAAVRGNHGGFITLGVGADALVPLTSRLGAEAGLSVAAGGGRGGNELAGGGLQTRAQLGLRYQCAKGEAVSIGISRVDFPDGGTIHSTQAYLAYTHAFSAWSLPPAGDATHMAAGLGSATNRFALFVEPLSVGSGVARVDGGPQRNLGLVGFEWQSGLGDRIYARLAAGGAASGSSSGYMQVLGGLGYRWPLAPRVALTASASVGAGGGGAVDTGGGMLLEAAAGFAFGVTAHDSLELSAVRLKAPSGEFAARGLTLRAAHRFGPDDGAVPPAMASRTEVLPVRVRVVDQEYRAPSAAWSARTHNSVGALGVQADYFVTPTWYLTGQGLAAYHGHSGAYMVGLAGAGWHPMLSERVYAEVEALAGAAGGGGAAVGSGVVGQLNAALGFRAANGVGLQMGIGRLQARRGGFAANVLSLAVTWQTDLLSGGD